MIMGDRSEDNALIKELGQEKYAELTYMHLRDMWAVDGLYYLGIEERFGTEAATEIDADVWRVMGKIEARKLKKLLGLTGDDIETMVKALGYSGWTMDLDDKEWDKGNTVLRNVECRVQNTRKKGGQGVFPCKKVRWGFLKAFAKEFNENIEVICHQCPPDERKKDLWCEWEFKMRE